MDLTEATEVTDISLVPSFLHELLFGIHYWSHEENIAITDNLRWLLHNLSYWVAKNNQRKSKIIYWI